MKLLLLSARIIVFFRSVLGAVQILRNIEATDFHILCSGRICIDEIGRVRRLVRKGAMKLPLFLKDISNYKKQLNKMAVLNGLVPSPPKITMQIRTISRSSINLSGKKKKTRIKQT